MIRLTSLGFKAHAALACSNGRVRASARLGASLYVTAGGELLWLGSAGSALHPRAMLAIAPFAFDEETAWVDPSAAATWRPQPFRDSDAARVALSAGCAAIRGAIPQIGKPEGLGVLLDGAASFDPYVERAAPAVRALGHACRNNDAAAALEPAKALLGLGPGLTPAGDDFVGGVLFARALLSRAGGRRSRWDDVAAAIVREATTRTHPVSAVLLGDFAAGEGFAPLHDLANALASAGCSGAALDAARSLVRIGHSSGWDFLTGFIAGVIGA